MFTQFDDDGQKFVVEYTSRSNNKMEVYFNKFIERERLVVV
jgi:hypothetical protein